MAQTHVLELGCGRLEAGDLRLIEVPLAATHLGGLLAEHKGIHMMGEGTCHLGESGASLRR
jgi:hypothetical protein